MLRLVLSLGLALAAVQAQAQGGNLERFQQFLRTTQSTTANFEQKVTDRNGKLVQESSGRFAFLRPGRFRWAYDKPFAQIIVGDGERVWVYDRDLNQVTVRRMAKALGSTPAALLAGASDVDKAFDLAEGGDRDGLAWVEAKPRDKDAGFERIRLGMSVAGIEAMELVDNFSQTTLLRFTKLVRNPQIDPETFRFTPPKGADVLGEK